MKEKLIENRIMEESDIEEIIDRRLAEMVGEHFKIKQKEEPHNHTKLHVHPKPHAHPKPLHPKHHEPLKIEFDFEENIDTIINTFGDESTAEAIIRSLKESPAEIQVIAKLIIDLHKRLDETLGE